MGRFHTDFTEGKVLKDFSTPRKTNSTDYINSPLKFQTINEMTSNELKQALSDYNLSRFTRYRKDELIQFSK